MPFAPPQQDRFRLNRDAIKRIARFQPDQILRLDSMDQETALKELELAHKKLFVPTKQLLDLLELFLGMARAHSMTTYPDLRAFVAGCHNKSPPLEDAGPLVCLTGLAGVGKSALANRLSTILREFSPRIADYPAIGRLPIVSNWEILAGERKSAAAVLSALHTHALEREYEILEVPPERRLEIDLPRDLHALIDVCRRRAYRDGVSMASVDELQFFTHSATANSLVTGLLLHLSSLGIPLIFISNFSLGHRLLRRNHEDQDRIFSRTPIVLKPEASDSLDWVDTLRGFAAVSPEIFNLDWEGHARRIHSYCGGLNRYLGRLIRIAYAQTRTKGGVVTIDALERAFRSRDFAYERTTIAELVRIDDGVPTKRVDLVCPFELPAAENARTRQETRRQRTESAATIFAEQQLTATERQTLSELRASAKTRGHGANIRPIDRLSIAALREAEQNRRSD